MGISSQNTYTNLKATKRETSSCIMLFAPWYYGHHPTYLRHLIRYWKQQQIPGTLNIVVMPPFLEKHEDVVNLATEREERTVKFVPMTNKEQVWLESTRPNFVKAFVQYQLIVRYARQLEATQGLLMHFDSCQIPLILGLQLPCPFYGIYFTPTLHYSQLPNYSPSKKERRQNLRERISLSLLFKHRQFKKLFCLDPIAVEFINQQFCDSKNMIHLPDPVEKMLTVESDVRDLKLKLGIGSDRKVVLAFGILAEPRKGTRQFLEALQLLKPELCQKICILLVGEPFLEGQAIVESWLTEVRQSLPIQAIARFGYVSESEVPLYFQLADLVMAPYQKHPGMSGILLLAAAAGKPILSSHYGLMGELVKQYGLGIAVDTTIVSEIARGLSWLVSESSINLCSVEGMATFTELNSPKKFASTIFQHICGD